jgi:hypothetical protein
MSTDLSTPVLLRRIAKLEATVGRLSEDLGSLRTIISQQAGPQSHAQLARRARVRKAQVGAKTAHPQATALTPATGGLAGAKARGEAARVQWIQDGLVVTGEQLAQAWGLTRQALAPAARRGEVFAVKVGNRLYYPQAFLNMDRDVVASICRALGDIDASQKLTFWLREHGALAGKTVSVALEAGLSLRKVESLALGWARERGALPDAAHAAAAA